MLRTLLTTTALAAMLSTGAIAQDATPAAPANNMSTDAQAPAADATTTAAPAATATSSILASGYTLADEDDLATEIIGRQVYSSTAADAEHIGDINNLVIGKSGEIAAVVIGVGGFLGIGEKNVAVNFSELQWVTAADNTERYVLPTTKDALQAAPDFVARDMDDAANNAMAPATDTTMAPADNNAMAPANNAATDAGNAVNNAVATAADATAGAATATANAANQAAANARTAIDRSTLTDATVTTDDLKGTRAYGPNDEDLGTVGDVVLGADGKTAEAVIIDFGGFLGMGTKPVAVGFDTLKFQQDQNGNRYVFLNVTRDQLDQAPAFNADTYKTDPAAQRLVVNNG
jgi:sporulation protein YlmC with PRC-barrel domain